ncbi:MAG: GAF domain-containing protein [Anaerolineae bacterium]|nr:GAF domain-containing protein [Anaerolineae bacterium]
MSKLRESSQIHKQLSQHTTDLAELFHQVLLETASANRDLIPTDDLKRMAAEEVRTTLAYVGQPDKAKASERGRQISQEGLGEETLLRLSQTARKFCLTHLPENLRLPALDVIDAYHQTVWQSFIQTRESGIVSEVEGLLQETIALQQLSRALSGTLDFDEILDIFFQTCTKVMGFDFVIFSLVDKDRQRIKAVAGVGITDSHLKKCNQALDSKDIMADTIRTGHTEIITGWDDRFDRAIYESEHHAEWGLRIFTPITLRRENIGLVEVGFNQNIEATVDESQVRLLRAFIDQTALALENVKRYEASQQAIQHEALIKEITTKVRASTDLDTILQTTVKEIGDALGGRRTYIHLTPPPQS